MAALDVVLALGTLAVVMLALRRRRALRRHHPAVAVDAPARLLGWAIGFLPADRAEWGQAMAGELDQVRQRPRRWRFALGCLAATLLFPARRAGAGRLMIVLVVAAAAGCAGLVGYGLLRYPAILTSRGTWPALALFGAVLAGFSLLTVVLVRRGAAAGVALAGGVGTAAVWIVFGYPALTYAQARPALSFLLLALPLAPLAVGAAAARHGRTGAAGRQIALLSAMVAGLVLFLALAADTLLTAAGPYDTGQLRDFPGSRFPDIASYAVDDNLGTAMSLLLLTSMAAAALGCAAATATAWLRRATPPTGDALRARR
jgi:hypothetical protein